MQASAVDLLVGGIFVVFHSAARFNTPSTNRSSTTAARYFLAVALYVTAALGSYAALVLFPHLVSFLLQGDGSGGGQLPEGARALSSPLVAALLLTVLLPRVPLLNDAATWACRRLQDLAAIPGEVRRLAAELRAQPLVVPPDLQEEVRRVLLEEGLDPRDVRFEPAPGWQDEWAGVTALLQRLEAWDGDRGMVGYLHECGEVLEKLRAQRGALRNKAKTCFRLLRETAALPEGDQAREAALHYAEDFREGVLQLRHDLLDFVSRGVLRAGLTDASRQERLAALGFTLEARTPGFTLDEMLSLAAVLAVLLLSASAILSAGAQVRTGVLLVRAVMVSAFYTVAVACAVVPKERWRVARRAPGGPFPVAFYLLAGLTAAALTQALGFGMSCLLGRGLRAGLLRWSLTYPWALVTFVAAVVTGALVDLPPPARPWPRRALEGLAGAGALVLAAFLAHGWLTDLRIHAAAAPPDYLVPPLVPVLATAGAVGFVVGVLVPHWHREAPRRAALAAGAAGAPTPTPVPAGARTPAGAQAGGG